MKVPVFLCVSYGELRGDGSIKLQTFCGLFQGDSKEQWS
jgi:hypothetical protein